MIVHSDTTAWMFNHRGKCQQLVLVRKRTPPWT